MVIAIQFPQFPIIYKWIEADFKKVRTESELIEFAFKCSQEAETSTNEVRKQAYEVTFNTIYKILTGQSFNQNLNGTSS